MEIKVHDFNDISVKILSPEDAIDKRIIRGRALVIGDEKRCTIVQNEPRPYRSKEIGRTAHARFVRRPDNLYTITLRVDGNEKYLRSTLISEVRDICDKIEIDVKQLKTQKNDDSRENKPSSRKNIADGPDKAEDK